jgi:MFS transporter, DHA3 family, multidrug efflux protein
MSDNPQQTFNFLLGNTLIASVTNSFIWFTVTFWVYLETESVLAASYVAGIFAVANMLSAVFFGSIVDRKRKKTAMVYSSVASLIFYALGSVLYFLNADADFSDPRSIVLWLIIGTLILGSVAGNLRMIALSTSVSLLFTENKDRANGYIGAVQGVSFALTSILSGLTMGFYGMPTALIATLLMTTLALIHLLTISLPEPTILSNESKTERLDLRGTLTVVAGITGLLPLIFFTTFNNFLGGVFMALMDAYGLSLMSVQAWGMMLSFLSIGFIAGSGFIARFGLGKNPLKRMLLVNGITWTTCIFFTIQPSIILLGLGMLIWMTLVPFIEAAEHTVIQKVVPYERQGRVFGFALSIESAASPITTFLIGPIAQFIFIPFMTTGAGVLLIGDWFGVGASRGIALVFIVAGIIGLIATLLAFQSRSYKMLARHLTKEEGVQINSGQRN